MHHSKLAPAYLQDLGAERSWNPHFLVGVALQALRALPPARIASLDAVDVGVDVAALRCDGGRDRDRGGIRSAPPQGGDAARLLVHALEAGEHRYLVTLLEAFDELGAVDIEDARSGMSVGGQDRQLPALPRPR